MGIKTIIKSQYRAAFAMLRQTLAMCPDALWQDTEHKHPFWHIAYHVIFYTHFYLHPTEENFVPWEHHRDDGTSLNDPLEENPEAYSKDELLAYLDLCQRRMETLVEALELDAASGFYWLPFNKLELQFYNIRHLQHHTGALCERLETHDEIQVDWVGMQSA